jgi:hypothetical protein
MLNAWAKKIEDIPFWDSDFLLPFHQAVLYSGITTVAGLFFAHKKTVLKVLLFTQKN